MQSFFSSSMQISSLSLRSWCLSFMARVCVVTSFVRVVGLSEPVLNNGRGVCHYGAPRRLTDDAIPALQIHCGSNLGIKSLNKTIFRVLHIILIREDTFITSTRFPFIVTPQQPCSKQYCFYFYWHKKRAPGLWQSNAWRECWLLLSVSRVTNDIKISLRPVGVASGTIR